MSPTCIRILKSLPSLLKSKDFKLLLAAMIKLQNVGRCEADWSTFAKRAKLQWNCQSFFPCGGGVWAGVRGWEGGGWCGRWVSRLFKFQVHLSPEIRNPFPATNIIPQFGDTPFPTLSKVQSKMAESLTFQPPSGPSGG